MNNEISLRFGSVYLGEKVNEFAFLPTKILTKNIPTNITADLNLTSLCLRLTIRGDLPGYGVLGCNFVPDENQITKVCVGIYEDESDNTLKKGLSADLAEAILAQSISQLTVNNFLGSGTLYFYKAKYHETDSNPKIFQVITATILSILSDKDLLLDPRLIEDIVTSFLNKPLNSL